MQRLARSRVRDGAAHFAPGIEETALLADFETARENLQALRGAGSQIVLDDFGAVARLTWDTARVAFRRPFEHELWFEQAFHLGVQSLTITNVTLLFTGMVLAIQTAYSLAAYGGKPFVGDIIALSPPLIISPAQIDELVTTLAEVLKTIP